MKKNIVFIQNGQQALKNKTKKKLNNILNENNEIIIILKKYDTGKIEFLEISKTEVLDCKTKIFKEFDKIESEKEKVFKKILK